MKKIIILLIVMLLTGCSGAGKKNEVSEHELYGKKRADCRGTKSTDEGANITQCAQIRPDTKELKNLRGTDDDSEYK